MRWLVVLVLISALPGCAFRGAPPLPPATDLPPAWSVTQAGEGDPLSTDWFRGFGSPELDSLIATAQHDSLDLQAADARLRQADARARAAGASILARCYRRATKWTSGEKIAMRTNRRWRCASRARRIARSSP